MAWITINAGAAPYGQGNGSFTVGAPTYYGRSARNGTATVTCNNDASKKATVKVTLSGVTAYSTINYKIGTDVSNINSDLPSGDYTISNTTNKVYVSFETNYNTVVCGFVSEYFDNEGNPLLNALDVNYVEEDISSARFKLERTNEDGTLVTNTTFNNMSPVSVSSISSLNLSIGSGLVSIITPNADTGRSKITIEIPFNPELQLNADVTRTFIIGIGESPQSLTSRTISITRTGKAGELYVSNSSTNTTGTSATINLVNAGTAQTVYVFANSGWSITNNS